MKQIVILLILIFSLFGFEQPRRTGTLPEQYVAALRSHVGAPYVEAGRTGGFSCSQFVRFAYLETNAPAASKKVISEKACLSEEMRAGCFGELEVVAKGASLPALNLSELRAGDVIVLGNKAALHTVAYLGEGVFIDADPVRQSVGTFTALEKQNPWFAFPATVLRWKALNL